MATQVYFLLIQVLLCNILKIHFNFLGECDEKFQYVVLMHTAKNKILHTYGHTCLHVHVRAHTHTRIY